MIKIIKQELNISPELNKKIIWAGKYTNMNLEIIKGQLIRLEPTNLAYVEPHKIIVNKNIFMFFNNKDIFCINELKYKFKLCELIHYLKQAKLNEYLDLKNICDNINNQ